MYVITKIWFCASQRPKQVRKIRKMINYKYYVVLKEKADQLLRRNNAPHPHPPMEFMWVMQWCTSSTASLLLRQGWGLWRHLHWKSGPRPGEGTFLGDPGDVDQMCNPPGNGFIQEWRPDTGCTQGRTLVSSPDQSLSHRVSFSSTFVRDWAAHSLRFLFLTKMWNAGVARVWEIDLDV